MSRESWKVIPSAPEYEASDLGRIRNARTGHVLSLLRHSDGYRMVHLGRHRRNRLVHRLVCEAFHGPAPLPTHHADHLNFDRADNRAVNLRWLAAGLNAGRHVIWSPTGWLFEDDAAPEDYTPMTDAESAALDADLAAAGW